MATPPAKKKKKKKKKKHKMLNTHPQIVITY